MKLFLSTVFCGILLGVFSINSFSQTIKYSTSNLQIVSSAPVSYRVNKKVGAKSIRHGYYKKGYNLTIYGDTSAIGFRADCDEDDDWSGAEIGGTTQNKNSFETKLKCEFNPHELYGTVLPGGDAGLRHYDGVRNLGVKEGDLTITYRVDQKGESVDSVIGVVFDRGPHNQPGESSVATRKKLGGYTDNNLYIYIVFPNSARYLKKIVGMKGNSDSLKRSPTNNDVEQAYALMNSQSMASVRKSNKEALLFDLSKIQSIGSFDNATAQEKTKSLQLPPNDDRNLND